MQPTTQPSAELAVSLVDHKISVVNLIGDLKRTDLNASQFYFGLKMRNQAQSSSQLSNISVNDLLLMRTYAAVQAYLIDWKLILDPTPWHSEVAAIQEEADAIRHGWGENIFHDVIGLIQQPLCADVVDNRLSNVVPVHLLRDEEVDISNVRLLSSLLKLAFQFRLELFIFSTVPRLKFCVFPLLWILASLCPMVWNTIVSSLFSVSIVVSCICLCLEIGGTVNKRYTVWHTDKTNRIVNVANVCCAIHSVVAERPFQMLSRRHAFRPICGVYIYYLSGLMGCRQKRRKNFLSKLSVSVLVVVYVL